MMTPPTRILTPTEVHGATSPEDYARRQEVTLLELARAHPQLGVRPVWVNDTHPSVHIRGGKWLLRCVCGNAPSVHPDWKVARCFECGAIYQGLDIPDDAAAIETALMRRPLGSRVWDPGMSAAELDAEGNGG